MKIATYYRYVSRQVDHATGEALSWSKKDGWGVQGRDSELRSVAPWLHKVPKGGKWVMNYVEIKTPWEHA